MLVPMTYLAIKNSDEIANEIAEPANSDITSKNSVVVSIIISRKDRFNNKAKEVNEYFKDKCKKHTANTAS